MWINCLLIFTSWYGTCCRCGNVGGFFAAVAAEHGGERPVNKFDNQSSRDTTVGDGEVGDGETNIELIFGSFFINLFFIIICSMYDMYATPACVTCTCTVLVY